MTYVDGFVIAVPSANENRYLENAKASFIEWPSKEARDTGMKVAMQDPFFADEYDLPFDGKRMIFGGFEMILDELSSARLK